MNVVERAKNMLLAPAGEWDEIADEAVTIPELYRNWIAVMAAIPAIATFIRISIVGMGVVGTSYRVPVGMGLVHAVVSWALTLGAVYVLALVIDALAPKFGAHRNFGQAFKVAAFAPTAAWVTGAFSILPVLSMMGILGLYSLYLLYLGLPRVMDCPAERSLAYTATVTVIGLVLYVAIIAVTGFILPGAGALR